MVKGKKNSTSLGKKPTWVDPYCDYLSDYEDEEGIIDNTKLKILFIWQRLCSHSAQCWSQGKYQREWWPKLGNHRPLWFGSSWICCNKLVDLKTLNCIQSRTMKTYWASKRSLGPPMILFNWMNQVWQRPVMKVTALKGKQYQELREASKWKHWKELWTKQP